MGKPLICPRAYSSPCSLTMVAGRFIFFKSPALSSISPALDIWLFHSVQYSEIYKNTYSQAVCGKHEHQLHDTKKAEMSMSANVVTILPFSSCDKNLFAALFVFK